MAWVVGGRYAARIDEPFVVFIIGMWLPLHKDPAALGRGLTRVRPVGALHNVHVVSFGQEVVLMVQVVPGRFTAMTDEPFVVFMIGMRINRPLAVRKWLPTMLAMGPMLRELYQHPEKGFLGAEFFFHGRGPVTLQYWRSFEDLERFARNPDDPHLPAWQRFNKTVGSEGSVGIFHETFIVERGNYEAIYSNMPVFGLAKSTEHVKAVGGRETARRRLMRGENEPAVPSPE